VDWLQHVQVPVTMKLQRLVVSSNALTFSFHYVNARIMISPKSERFACQLS
jgi:hypothetical protein